MKKLNFILFLIFGLITACSLNDPKLPAWDTEWTLHLPTEDFVISEAIDDSIFFADTTDSGVPIISLSIEDSTDWERIKPSDLAMAEQTKEFNATIGLIEVTDASDVQADSVKVMDILPPGLLLGDTLPPHGPFPVTVPDAEVEFDHFSQAHVHEGNLWLTFHNEMFLEIDAGMSIDIYTHNGTSELVGTLLFTEPIPPGAVVTSDLLPLGGKLIYNQLRISYTITIAGSDTSYVLTNEHKNGFFYSVLSMDRLVVDWAIAKIPQQDFEVRDSVEVAEEDFNLRTAIIEKGGGVIRLDNQLPINVAVKLELPDFHKDDSTKVIERYLLANQQYVIPIDLKGWQIENSDDPSQFVEYIHSIVYSTVDSSIGFTEIHSTDYIDASVEFDSLYFKSFNGEIENLEFDVEPTENEGMDFFADIKGGIKLTDLEMNLLFENEIDFPIDIDLMIVAYREEDGQIIQADSLRIQETIRKNSVSPQTAILLNKDSSTPSIVDILAILPTKIKFYGQASIQGEGTVAVNQGMRVQYSIYSPLSLNIESAVIQESEIDTLDDLDDDAREALSNDVQEAAVQLILTNGLPIGAEVYLYLATDREVLTADEIVESDTTIILYGIVAAGQTDANGYVTQPEESIINIELNKTKLDMFSRLQLYTKQKFIVEPTQGTIRFKQTDEIKFDAMVKVKYILNNE